MGSEKALDKYAVNLNEKAAEGKIDPLIGRQSELDRTIQVLCRRTKNNPLLVGDPEVFLNVFKIYAYTEMITWLKNISKPCLLMTGENDLGCSPDHNKKMASEILNSKLVILPKYKHSFLIEAPKEVAKNLIKFI